MSGENLRDWVQEVKMEKKRGIRYKSRHDPKTKPAYSTFTKNVPTEIPKGMVTRKPKVPTRTDRPVYGLKTNKDFKTSNAVEAILTVPSNKSKPPERFVHKKDYGKVPKYLENVKADIQMEKAMLEEYLAENQIMEEETPYSDLPEADRIELIKSLKRKWEFINHQFQNMVSTLSKTKAEQKEAFQNELTQIEEDIKLLSRGSVRVEETYY